jgi:6-phosphofructokinase 2
VSRILTVTVNPAVDAWTSIGRIAPTGKMRCEAVRRDPGGGGLNVARVAHRLGADVTAIYTSGGPTGRLLQRLVDDEGIHSIVVEIHDETREDLTITETETGAEYRFVLAGPRIAEGEWRRCLDALAHFEGRMAYIVASGSLPPGAPDDFYARASRVARARNLPFALDASGAPLEAGVEEGVDRMKASLSELRHISGSPLPDDAAQVEAAARLVERGKARYVVVTLGEDGAFLVSAEGSWRAEAIPVKPVTTVGAGDSFLGAMIAAFTSGATLEQAFRHGVAGATASLLSPGTQLCHAPEQRSFLDRVRIEPIAVRPAAFAR